MEHPNFMGYFLMWFFQLRKTRVGPLMVLPILTDLSHFKVSSNGCEKDECVSYGSFNRVTK